MERDGDAGGVAKVRERGCSGAVNGAAEGGQRPGGSGGGGGALGACGSDASSARLFAPLRMVVPLAVSSIAAEISGEEEAGCGGSTGGGGGGS